MSSAAISLKMTSDEFLAWEEKQPDKHEFVNGEIYAMTGVTRRHATVAGNIFVFLAQHLRSTPCRVYMADMKLKLQTADAFFYPDVFVTCSEADHRAERFMSEPRVIVEVLSESTEAYDRGQKFGHYRRFDALVEYALIHPEARTVELFRRDAAGHWVLYEFNHGEAVTFASLELTIAGEELYQNV